MKRLGFLLLITLALTTMVFTSCTTVRQVAAPEIYLPTLETSVTAIDKYGNLSLSLSESFLLDAGYEVGDVVKITVGDFSYDAPIGTAYSDVDKGRYIVRLFNGYVLLALNQGDLAKVSSARENIPVSITLSEKGGYLQELELRRLVRTDVRADYSSDEIFADFRMVAHGSIQKGLLYRSASPLLADARTPYVATSAELVGIKTVINLTKNQKDLAFIANHKGPYLVYSSEKEEMAGFVSALLSALMGATVGEIVEDYMITYENYYGVEKGTVRYGLISRLILNHFAAINGGKSVTDKTINKVAVSYLLNQVGLSPTQIDAIKDNLSGNKTKVSGQIVFAF